MKILRWAAVAAALALSACATTDTTPKVVASAYMVFFGKNESALVGQTEVLDEVVSVLKKYPETRVQITGHRGRYEPRTVDEKRVAAVVEALAQAEIGRERMVAVTAEASAPVGSARDGLEEGNRRVELYVLVPPAS